MTTPSDDQKQLIFDYCIGLTSQQQATEAEELIASSEQARQLYTSLKTALSPLQAIELQDCPDWLVESTVARVNQAAAGQEHLRKLLAAEQSRSGSSGGSFWPTFGRYAAVAAVVLAAVGIWLAPLDLVRQKYWQQRCQMQMAQIFRGLSNYIADHDGQMPAVPISAGQPWWKVGYQGRENHSNTRNYFLLVKQGYTDCRNFVCPGCAANRAARRRMFSDKTRLARLNDFPSRKEVTYSFRIRCTKTSGQSRRARRVLIADLNPLFQNLPSDYSKPLRIRVDFKVARSNSSNHGGRGQNVLFNDGTVRFMKTRQMGVSQDDIFLLQEMRPGYEVRGCEWPSCETDAFLAP